MERPKLLDLFSGAGGAARGYQMAGFHVTGVDHKPQPRYAGDVFVQGDALDYCREHGHEFDAIHASPPCQAYSEATPIAVRKTLPDLIDATRDVLLGIGKPYVIENVENARRKLRNPVMLCGSMFGLGVWWHRYFETHPFWLLSASGCRHEGRPTTPVEGSNARRGRSRTTPEMVSRAMGIDWMNKREMTQAIPPAYAEYIGRQLMQAVRP